MLAIMVRVLLLFVAVVFVNSRMYLFSSIIMFYMFMLLSLPPGNARRLHHVGVHARNHGASSSLVCCSSVCKQPDVSIMSIRVPVVIASS